jgi:hypothetical protein
MVDIQISQVDAKLESRCGSTTFCFLTDLYRKWTTCNETDFVNNEKYSCGGQLKVKIRVLFHGGNS